MRLDWLNLRAILPDSYFVNPALKAPRVEPLLSRRLLDNVVVVSGTPILLVDDDEQTPNAARWGLGCSFSACTAVARGRF